MTEFSRQDQGGIARLNPYEVLNSSIRRLEVKIDNMSIDFEKRIRFLEKLAWSIMALATTAGFFIGRASK